MSISKKEVEKSFKNLRKSYEILKDISLKDEQVSSLNSGELISLKITDKLFAYRLEMLICKLF